MFHISFSSLSSRFRQTAPINSSLFKPSWKKSFKYSLHNLQHGHFRLQSNTFLFPQELHQQDAIITCLPPSAWVVRWEAPAGTYTQRSGSYIMMSKLQPWTHLLPASPCSDRPRDKGVQSTLTSLMKRCSMRHYPALLLISRNRNGRHTTNIFHFSLNKIVKNSKAMWKASPRHQLVDQ